MSGTVYFNGRIVPDHEAAVSVFDSGWLHGAGLFETMRAENGRIFRLDAHLERLRTSAELLLGGVEEGTLPTPEDLMALLKKNGLSTARVRLTMSAGDTRDPLGDDPPRPTVCVTVVPLSPYPASCYEKGVGVVICSCRVSPTDPVAGHKTTGYLPRLLGLREAKRMNCQEALWFTTGNALAEGSISNVFVVRSGTIQTPPLDTPVLPGIARRTVLSVAADAGVEAREQSLTINDLLDADEVFLTNTIMQIIPVIRVEKHDIGGGRVGPVAKKLHDAYRHVVARECSNS